MAKKKEIAMPRRLTERDFDKMWAPDNGICWVCGLTAAHIMDGRWICRNCLREAYA